MVTEKDLALLEEYSIWIHPNEKAIWVGQHNKQAYVANEFWELSRGILFVISAIGFFILIGILFKTEMAWFGTSIFFGIVVISGLYALIKRLVERRSTVYMLTDSRIIIFKRFTQSDITFLELSGIVSQELRRTFVDRKYSTGTLAFHSGVIDDTGDEPKKVYDYFHSIGRPNEVLNLVVECRHRLSERTAQL